jgi:hypothetical protein
VTRLLLVLMAVLVLSAVSGCFGRRMMARRHVVEEMCQAIFANDSIRMQELVSPAWRTHSVRHPWPSAYAPVRYRIESTRGNLVTVLFHWRSGRVVDKVTFKTSVENGRAYIVPGDPGGDGRALPYRSIERSEN